MSLHDEIEFNPIAAARIEDAIYSHTIDFETCSQAIRIFSYMADEMSPSGMIEWLRKCVKTRKNDVAAAGRFSVGYLVPTGGHKEELINDE